MPFFTLKLRHKLTLITMLTSVGALVLACAAFLGYELVTFKRTLTRDLAILGDVIGDNSTAALTFGDNEAAKGVLGSLRALGLRLRARRPAVRHLPARCGR
jgi:hypothetical protein